MADLKISQLNSIVTVVPATDVLPVVQGGTTLKITPNQILGAGGTATLASATITGDLTVRTNGLVVNTTGVGIGVTPNVGLSLTLNGEFGMQANNLFYWNGYYSGGFKARAAGYSGNIYLSSSGDFLISNTPTSAAGAGSVASFYERYRINKNGEHTWEYVSNVAGTAMTLNSTGLGIGGSPYQKLTVVGIGYFAGGASSTEQLRLGFTDGTSYWGIGRDNVTTGNLIINNAGSSVATFSTSGNVGIGVTPTNAYTTSRALQIGQGGLLEGRTNDYTTFSLATNAYLSSAGDWTYSSNAKANLYAQSNGAFTWASVAAGTGVATFTPAMTLDSSGNLLVGKTSSGFGTVGNEMRAVGEIFSTQASNSNAATTYHAYSTTAAVYRFYVGLGGTVFATNTVISAISDARLKENVQDIDVGLAAILSLKPRKFDWKSGKGKDIKGDRGFIAQEFETVFPNLVDDWKDPAPEGEAPYKSVRQDLIPVLVKAIQELTARLQTLEAR